MTMDGKARKVKVKVGVYAVDLGGCGLITVAI